MQFAFFSSKILFLVFVFFFTFALPVNAADFELVQRGAIQSIRGITRAGDNLIGVGNTGNIVVSTDEGVEWTTINTGSAWLLDVDARADGTVHAVGVGGVLLTSNDNGLTWTPISSGIASNLNAIDSGERTIVVGDNGSVLVLSNNSWVNETGDTTAHLYGVYNLSNNISSRAVGFGGRMMLTENAGTSWTDFGTLSAETLRGVYYKDSAHAFVVGDSGRFKSTADSGVSWSNVSVEGLNSQQLWDIEAFGETVVIAGEKIVIVSEDNGASFSATTFNTGALKFYDSHIDTDGTIWLVGTDDDVSSVIYKRVPIAQDVADVSTTDEPTQTDTSADPDSYPSPGSLIKTYCSVVSDVTAPCRAVYFYGTDGKRHAFTNEKVFFTWYDNFDTVVEVTTDFMSSLPLGKNVTYHPGTKMVKFLSVPTVYAVEKGGILRAISSEQVAEDLYGTDWNKKIDDISVAFFGNYTFGNTITSKTDYNANIAKLSTSELNENF